MNRIEARSESDPDLLRRYRAGDEAAFGTVYRRHARPLFLYAFSMTRDPSLAEDFLQQAFLKVLALEPEAVGESLRGLLFASVRNLMRDRIRKVEVERRHYPRLEVERPDAGVSPDELEALSRALDQLPPEQREAVVMKIHGNLTFAEMAGVLGEPEPTLKSRYRYGLQKLSELLR
jgi:RNA polymerase sigma factor (sigma-70 family)